MAVPANPLISLSPEQAAPLLRSVGLSVFYASTTRQAVPALYDVHFEMAAGEIAGILGESGSGKSTLARTLLNLLPGDAQVEGKVFFREQPLLHQEERDLRALRGAKISLVHQEPSLSLSPFLRIGAQISEVLRAHRGLSSRARRQEVLRALHEVHLDAERVYDAYPHQLSGGQLHRAAIAQAFACRPDLVIADESTRSLDGNTQAEIMALLKEWNAKYGTAILLITHNPALLVNFASQVFVMRAGRIVESGPVSAIFSNPSQSYTRQLLQFVPQSLVPEWFPPQAAKRVPEGGL